MLAIAISSGIMAVITFFLIIAVLAANPPFPKLRVTFATVGFLLLGGVFIVSALNSEAPCDYGEQKIVQGESKVCIPDHELLEYLESNK